MIQKAQLKVKEYIEKMKLQFFEILRSEKSDDSVALGFSVGTIISILPTPGLNIILTVLAGLIFKSLNKVALTASLLFWNPISMLFIYFLSYKIGEIFYTGEVVRTFNVVILDTIYDYSVRYLIGNVICAISFSLLGYFIIRLILILNRKYVKKEFADVNTDLVEPKEKEEKVEHHEHKVEINVKVNPEPGEQGEGHQNSLHHEPKKEEHEHNKHNTHEHNTHEHNTHEHKNEGHFVELHKIHEKAKEEK